MDKFLTATINSQAVMLNSWSNFGDDCLRYEILTSPYFLKVISTKQVMWLNDLVIY